MKNTTSTTLFLAASIAWARAVTGVSYEHICSTASNNAVYVSETNRRSLLQKRSGVLEAVKDEIWQGKRQLDDLDPQPLSDNNSNNQTVPVYQCACEASYYMDNRTRHFYCPLNYACGIPLEEDLPVDCIDSENEILNDIARMAWPICLTSTLCLILVFVASMAGLALVKFVKKNNYRMTKEERQHVEQEEVDELLRLSEQTPPLERPPRYKIWAFQTYQYQLLVLTGARVGWRREWNHYRRTHATTTQLYFKNRVYSGTPSPPNPLSVEGGDEDDNDNDNAGSSCSICFAELKAGQRVGDLDCGHDFHSVCLKTWIGTGRRNTCPLCQAPNIARPRPQRPVEVSMGASLETHISSATTTISAAPDTQPPSPIVVTDAVV